MIEMGPNKTDINGILQGLRREFARQAEQARTIEAIAGGQVDRDLPLDYWRFSDADLENELWSRIPELDQAVPDLGQAMLDLDQAMLDLAQAIDILPSSPLPAGPGLSGKVKGRFKNLLLHLAMPLIRITLEKQDRLNRITLEKQDRLNRITLEKQDRLNRLFKHLQFIQFLTVKQLRQRLQRLESENRELRSRLDELETENAVVGEASGHE